MRSPSRRVRHLEKHAGRYYKLKYVNAKDVLPPDILAMVQKYACGSLIYVPKKNEERMSWGQRSGAKEQVHQRNISILEAYRGGTAVSDLMEEYCLSEASIRKIIYNKSNIQALQALPQQASVSA